MTKLIRNLFDGISTVMDVWPARPIEIPYDRLSDADAIKSDWAAVGNDLRYAIATEQVAAIEQVAHEQTHSK